MKRIILHLIGILLIFSVHIYADEILPGEYKTGYLEAVEFDTYTFYADAGDVVSILMGEMIDYGDFDPQIELIESDGNLTRQWGSSSAAINAKTINQSGIHTIIIREKDGDSAGTYGLSLVKNPGTDVNDPEDEPVPILPGEYKRGYIAKGDLDGYSFYADIGDVVTILMGEIGDYGGFCPYVELIEPNGVRTTSGWRSGSYATINAKTINQSGIHMIIAREYYGIYAGTYGLSLIKNPGTDVNDPEDDPVPILPGEYKSGYIAKGDMDGYSFYADAGNVVSVLMGEVIDYGDFDPQVEIIEPNGVRTMAWGSTSAKINAKIINQSGIHMIIARENYGNSDGTYGLSLIKNPGTDVNDPEDDSVPIQPGGSKVGYIAEGDLDGYSFYANAGDVVAILVIEVGDFGGFDPQVELIEPDGTITSAWDNSTAVINFKTINQSGIHMIIVREYDGNSAGTYLMSLQRF